MKTRRKYDQKFKRMALELSKHQGDVKSLAEELEIKPDLLYRWHREAFVYWGASFPVQGNPKLTEEEKKIARQKKELREIQGIHLPQPHLLFQNSTGKIDQRKESGSNINDICVQIM